MNITVTTTQVSVDTDYILNSGEYNINQCYFTFSDEYTDDLVKKAIFVQGTSTVEMAILNNQCQIPAEVLNNGQFQIRVYAYESNGDELILRYSPSYATAYVRTGSYLPNAESPEVITPTQFEQYMQAMNDGLNEVANVNIDAEQEENGMSVTITDRNGDDKTVYAYNGRGIVSITLTSSDDYYDTYTILYSDGTTSTYTSQKAVKLLPNTVEFNNLNQDLEIGLYGSTSDIATNLGWYLSNYNTNASKISSPIFLKKGSVITISSSFVTNYHWKLYSINRETGALTSLFNEVTSTTYTLENDLYGAIGFRPIDNNWESTRYSVDDSYIPTNTDIQMTYYYSLSDGYELNDLDGALIKNMWCKGNCVHSSKGLGFYGSTNRIGLTRPLISSFPIRVIIKEGYQAGVVRYSSSVASLSTFIDDSGWTSGNFVIPANTYFTLSLRKSDNSNLTFNKELVNQINLVSYNGNLTSKYNYDGINLNLKTKHYFQSQQLFAGFKPNHDTTLPGNTLQGMDIYNGYIYQLCNNLGIQIIDLATGTQVSFISLPGIDHGDTGQFSTVKYADTDLCPLFYVISDTTPSVVHIVRIIDTNTATIVKNYVLSNDDGYHAGQCFDFENGIMYSFGYKVNDARDGTGNSTIVAVYNMNNETLISDNNYSLELIERYEIPFIYVIQGQKFINGICYLVSSYLTSEQPTIFYAYDPIRKSMVATFTNLPAEINTTECEDIAFIPDGDRYAMITFTRRYYTKITFL